MPSRWIPYLKAALHLLCLLPLVKLLESFRSGALGLMADPVNYITHLTGYWALFLLIASLAVTPVRRLHPRLANLIRLRRMLGLYAFFYATLHLATYVFLFSGYDLPTAWAGLRAGHLAPAVDAFRARWPTMLADARKRPFIQLGLVAWCLLLPLALTSPTFMLRAMGGRPWQTLHRIVYGAAILGVIHWWWLVKTGVRAPLAMTVVLAILLAARIAYSIRKRLTPAPQRIPPAPVR